MSVAEQLEIPFGPQGPKERVLDLAFTWGTYGVTVAEVRERLDMHHGQASSALSLLHQEGRLRRLEERRERCSVYVVPGSVHDRPTVPYGRRKGLPEGPTEDDVVAAFQRGRRNGREDALQDVGLFTRRIREAVLLGRNMAKRHDAHCYKEHPECALLAVMKFIDGNLLEVSGDAQPVT